jgi:hypothetical protein
MSIVYSDDTDITYWPLNELHDINSSKYYFIDYRPDIWAPSTHYIKGVDLVIPPTANGCMYECTSGGTSASILPVFPTLEGREFKDADVSWRVLPFAARLGYGDNITSSTWTSSIGVTILDDELIGAKTAAVKVSVSDTTLCEFDLINTISITRSTGRSEIFKKTLRITVGVL